MTVLRNRRQVLAGLAGVAATGLMLPSVARAQESAPGLSATPEVQGLGVVFPDGVLPTIYGDIAIPESVERVVTIVDGALDAAISVGVVPVGLTRSSNGETVASYLMDDVPEDATYLGGWSEVEDGLDLELMVSLAPDVILADRYLSPEQYDQMSQIAPTFATGDIEVAVEDADGLQQWEYEALAWAHVLGKEQEAQAAIEGARARAQDIADELGDAAGNSVVVFRPQPDFPVAMAQAWITGRVLTWSGLTGNELTEALPPPHSLNTLSLEQLDQLNADWLFAATWNQEQTDALDDYLENPLFQQLDAVANDQVVPVDGALWSGATGVQASHAMMDDIERIIVNGER